MRHARFFQLCVVVFLALSAFAAQTSVHVYRYEIHNRTGDSDYREELPAGVPSIGPAFEVERDQAGRLIRETDYEDGKATATERTHFTGMETLPDSFEIWINGQKSSVVKMQRNAAGVALRYDTYTANGELTSYTVVKELADRQDVRGFGPQGTPVDHVEYFFGPSGALNRRVSYVSPTSDEIFMVTELDEQTGQRLNSRTLERGKVVTTQSWTYSADGDLTRVDSYLEGTKWYGASEGRDGLLVRKIVALADGATKEVRYTYDDKRLLKLSEMFYNDQLVCTLTYEMASDGTAQRTIARYPDGTVFEEFPPPAVNELDRHGQVTGRTDAIRYGTKDLW